MISNACKIKKTTKIHGVMFYRQGKEKGKRQMPAIKSCQRVQENAEMTIKTREKLLDFAAWFNEHKDEATDVRKQMEFQKKAMDNIMYVMAYLLKDILALEHRGSADISSALWVPDSVRKNGGMRTDFQIAKSLKRE